MFFLLCQSFVTLPFFFDGKLLFTYAFFLALSASFAATNLLFNKSFSLAFNNFIQFQLLFIFTLLMMVFTILFIVRYSDCIIRQTTYCIFLIYHLWYQQLCFPGDFTKFFRVGFLQNISERLLLDLKN